MSRDAVLPPSQRLLSEWTDTRLSFLKRDDNRKDGLSLLGDVTDPLFLDAIVRLGASEAVRSELDGLSNVVLLDRFEDSVAFEESDRILGLLGKAKTTVPRLVLRDDLGQPTFASELHPLTLDGADRLRSLLAEMRRLRGQEPEKLRGQAEEIGTALRSPPRGIRRVGEATLRSFERALTKRLEAASEDLEHPAEYPTPDEISLLLRICATRDDPSARQILTDVLTGLVQGSFFDQIGGGFFERRNGREPSRQFKRTRTLARYASVLFEAHQLTKHSALRRAARATLDFLTRRLARPGGGFFAGLDFAKRSRSLTPPSRETYGRIVGRDFSEPFAHFFGIAASSDVARLPSSWTSLEKTAARFSIAPTVLADRLAEASDLVREAFEAEEVNLDERLFFEDTGWVIVALVAGYRVIADPVWLDLALDSYEFLREARTTALFPEHLGIFREEGFGKGVSSGLVANLRAAIALHEVSGDSRFRHEISALDELLGESSSPDVLEARLLAARVLENPDRIRASKRRIEGYFARTDDPPASAFLALGRALWPRFRVELRLAPEDSGDLSRVLGTTYLPFRDEIWLTGETTSLTVEGFGTKILLAPGEDVRTALVELVRRAKPRPYLLERKLEGRASAERTSAFLDRKGVEKSARTVLAGIEIARLAIGTHRTGLDQAEHAEALREALLGGMNVIDTGPTFSFGDAERAIGNVLADLVDSGELAREEVVLLDKVGTFVGKDRLLSSENPDARRFPLRPGESLDLGFSSLDPLLLGAELESERTRLGVATIDVVFLALPIPALLELKPDERDSLVVGAVDFLRKEKERGTVGAAGLTASSAAELDAAFTLVDRIGFEPELFRAASLPLNIVENDAVRDAGIGAKLRERGVALFAYRPLTDLSAGCVRRLVPVQNATSRSADKLRAAEYRVRSLESELETKFLPRLDVANAERPSFRLALGNALGPKLLESNSLEQMEHAEATIVSPALGRTLRVLSRRLGPIAPDEWPPFYGNYLEAAGAYLAEIHSHVAQKNVEFLAALAKEHGKDAAAFPRFALRWLLEEGRADVAVVGIRRVTRAKEISSLLGSSDVEAR